MHVPYIERRKQQDQNKADWLRQCNAVGNVLLATENIVNWQQQRVLLHYKDNYLLKSYLKTQRNGLIVKPKVYGADIIRGL